MTKIPCKVFRSDASGRLAAAHEALAHIVHAKYNDDFTAWYGSVLVICTIEEEIDLLNSHKATLKLEDGRSGEVHWMGGHSGEASGVMPGEHIVSDEYRLLYFVGTSALPTSSA